MRLEHARKFAEWIAQQSTGARPQLLQAPGGKERMAAYFEEQYIRNPPGEYEIVARYAPATGKWKGALISESFRLTITDTGDFFEDLKGKFIQH